MKQIADWLRAHPVAVFLAFVYPLSWYQLLLGLADEPGDSGINPLGPLVAALLAGLLTRGPRALLTPFRQIATFRGGPQPWMAAVLLPAGVCALAVVLANLSGFGAPTATQLSTWPAAANAFVFILVTVALGEEPGWRGYLLNHLQDRVSPFQAVLAVSAVWAVWHAPLLRTEFTPQQIAPFLLALLGASILSAWLFNASRGGLLPAMLMHATTNAVGAEFLFTFYRGEAKLAVWWIYAALWVAVGAATLFLTRGRLGHGEAGALGGTGRYVEAEEAPS